LPRWQTTRGRRTTLGSVFSFQSRQGYFRLVRRAGRWYVEFDGVISRTFPSAGEAATAVSRGQSGLPVAISDPPPACVSQWRRGDLPPLWPPAPPCLVEG
jgi:hypothetical protein